MELPGTIDLRQADVHLASDVLMKYCEKLTEVVSPAQQHVVGIDFTSNGETCCCARTVGNNQKPHRWSVRIK